MHRRASFMIYCLHASSIYTEHIESVKINLPVFGCVAQTATVSFVLKPSGKPDVSVWHVCTFAVKWHIQSRASTTAGCRDLNPPPYLLSYSCVTAALSEQQISAKLIWHFWKIISVVQESCAFTSNHRGHVVTNLWGFYSAQRYIKEMRCWAELSNRSMASPWKRNSSHKCTSWNVAGFWNKVKPLLVPVHALQSLL